MKFEDIIEESAKEHLLKYTIFLLKNGYCDSDVIDELPTSIDRYLNSIRAEAKCYRINKWDTCPQKPNELDCHECGSWFKVKSNE